MARYRPRAQFYVEAVEWLGSEKFSERPIWLEEAIKNGVIEFLPLNFLRVTNLGAYAPGSKVIKFMGGSIGAKTEFDFSSTYERIPE